MSRGCRIYWFHRHQTLEQGMYYRPIHSDEYYLQAVISNHSKAKRLHNILFIESMAATRLYLSHCKYF